MSKYLKLIALICTVISAISPIYIYIKSRRRKFTIIHEFVELFNYRQTIIDHLETNNDITKNNSIKEKLINLQEDIELEILNKSKIPKSFNLKYFVLTSVIEIIILFILFTKIIVISNRKYFNFFEGILSSQKGQYILLSIIVISSVLISFEIKNRFEKFLKEKINLYLFIVFNIVGIILTLVTIGFLSLTDNFISLY